MPLTPPNVDAAIDAALTMPDGKWPGRWQYPDPDADKARSVWEALKIARDYLEDTFGETFTPEIGELASNTVTRIRARIMDHAIRAKSGPKAPGIKL